MAAGEAGAAVIGKSVQIRGEVNGSEDLIVDGVVEGTITLNDSEFRTFQMNDPSMTECRSDGLAINSYYSEQNQSISACQGPRIHVVLFRPSQIPSVG